VNAGTATLIVENELGLPVPLSIVSTTNFYFRTPAKAESDANAIGQGPAFLSNLVRGFKVHASVVDPLAVPLVADSVDIEIARYDGTISASNLNSFTYTHNFHTKSDDYTVTLPFISSSTANGSDPQTGAAISGFKWWNFTFPTIVDSGANAILDFDNATGGAVNFGCAAAPCTFSAAGETYAVWDGTIPATPWNAPWTVLIPTEVPLGTAATGYSNTTTSFTMTVLGGTNAVPVDLNTTSGSATLVYQVDFTNNILTISPVDISTTAGQNTLSQNLLAGTPVKVYGIPQANGSIKDYVLFYFTGVAPAPASLVN
jgi:hypothetical protein